MREGEGQVLEIKPGVGAGWVWGPTRPLPILHRYSDLLMWVQVRCRGHPHSEKGYR